MTNVNPFGIRTARVRRVGSGQPTVIDGNPVIQTKGDNFYVDGNRSASGGGESWDTAFVTVGEGKEAAVSNHNDKVHVAPYSSGYDEAEIDFSKAGVQYIGQGPVGSVFLQSTQGPVGKISSNDNTFINIGMEGLLTAAYVLDIQDQVMRARLHGCKLEAASGVLDVLRLTGAGDVLLDECELAWGGYGIVFVGGLISWPTQIVIKNSRFHNLSVSHLYRSDVGGATLVKNLQHINNIHDAMEDGTEPSDSYVRLDIATSTGLIAGNQFATATLANTVFIINADGLIKWGANGTEAGWSSARPA